MVRTSIAILLGGMLFWRPATAAEPVRVPIPVDWIQPEHGYCYIACMNFGEEGDKVTRNGSKLIVFEDGKPLGPAHAVHEDIRRKGEGRYSHWTRATLYFSASDNSDPRTNGRTYTVASDNPINTLGGLARFPVERKQHIEEIAASRRKYTIQVGGTLDMDNTRTLATDHCDVAFQNNVALVIENEGDVPVVNPRIVINDRGNWYTFSSLLDEFTRRATTDQEKAYFIWQHMRENLYHQTPLFGDAEPHDPVRLFNVFGFNLCDDAGNACCSLFYHAGLTGSRNRALNGHVQCEAFVDGRFEFLDVDMDCFYLDRANEHPVDGDSLARDHDLVRRELNYGLVVDQFTSSDVVAALFGPDDRRYDARWRGHEIAYTLRPGERVEFRWDNIGKFCADSDERARTPRYFGNSKFVYRPRLSLASVQSDAFEVRELVEPASGDSGAKLVGRTAGAALVYQIEVPYPIVGGTVRAEFHGQQAQDTFSIAMSLDSKTWNELWSQHGAGPHRAEIVLDEALAVHRRPAKYHYFVRVGLDSTGTSPSAALCKLELETDVLAAPVSLPRLRVGTNRIVYWDATPEPHRVRITHQWKECDAIHPLAPVQQPISPEPGAEVHSSLVRLEWPEVDGADRYHLQVSRRADFAYPYRPSLDVIIPTTEWSVPYTGIFSPGTVYHWRLRCRDRWGVWGPWSDPWTFTWRGPCMPVGLGYEQHGQTLVLRWQPNPRGEQPVKYEVYGSDEKGFSVHKEKHEVPGRGKVPGNFLGETTGTSMVVVSPTATAENANKVFYRVVAIDARETASGCSDFVELPHPFVYSEPVTKARVGQTYRYEMKSLQSLGDYQARPDPESKVKRYVYRYWDGEQNTFRVIAGPAWLSLDQKTGLLSGTPRPDDAGRSVVIVEARNQYGMSSLQRYVLTILSTR